MKCPYRLFSIEIPILHLDSGRSCNSHQSDEQFEQVIQILEDMLRGCIIEFRGSWEEHFLLAEFAYNDIFQSSTQMAILRPYMVVNAEHLCVGPN
ncbi:reverse transcriptase [Gossypium australe]|uniref:Reverse transcriptase n=1 Tax=Gossypium australe TaxID=47621 RepID=A0A5B6WNQ0_9ROSI|nr:reverse transcriptase [Gossypium australe]